MNESVFLKTCLLGRRLSEFSGGQRQLIALDIALSGQFDLIVLDEIFSGIDVNILGRILEALEVRINSYPFLLITSYHRLPEMDALVDQRITLQKDKVVIS